MNVKKHSENATKRSVVTFSNILHTVVAANITMNRRASSTKKTTKQPHHVPRVVSTHGRMKMDSHADTIVLGSNAIILQYTSREKSLAICGLISTHLRRANCDRSDGSHKSQHGQNIYFGLT